MKTVISFSVCEMQLCRNRPNTNYSVMMVQGTNDNSIVSKCSSAAKAYFSDEFLQHFVGKKNRRSPLIHWGYYIRAKAVDHMINSFLAAFPGRKQILSLGAGFDSMYFRLKASGKLESVHYYEIDFKDVLLRKCALIGQNSTLLDLTQANTCSFDASSNINHVCSGYTMIAADLTQLPQLSSVVETAGIDPSIPTFILSEVVLTYIRPKQSSGVIQWAAKIFPQAMFVTYEQMNPSDSFGLFMCQHFKNVGSPLRSIETFPLFKDQIHRYESLGWDSVSACDMNCFYFSVLSEEDQVHLRSLEPFDEFEEWHLTCAHYFLLNACNGQCSNLKSIPPSNPLAAIEEVESSVGKFALTLKVFSSDQEFQQCYGHTSSLVTINGNQCIASIGGFGGLTSNHSRISSIECIDVKSEVSVLVQTKSKMTERLYHSATVVDTDTILVLWGRKSPMQACQSCFQVKFTASESCEINEFETGSMPSARWRHSATYVKRHGIPHIVVFGGRDSNDVLGDCHILNLETQQWNEVPSPHAPRHSHSADLWNNQVIIACGLDLDMKPIGSLLALDVMSLQWRMIGTQNLIPRYSHVSAISQDTLFLVGGISLTPYLPHISAVNLTSGITVHYNMEIPKGIWMLHNQSCIVLAEHRLVLTGGGGNCFSFGTHLNASPCSLQLPL
ncbi:hypothetical protein CAPTEDRAFT_220116 [Capitella teleta]|uniref:tRNA wybutosine-synthesizing protein 4 n=1 Tax=Capitella teleta TaxID=283909 RepID=R7URS4_CAPTE|nr:hypothetical protein CAPTEDRAFT_220116 [Capitella teleta]|eukprot:ELU06607.1 hypothetical protein CAPTEDRAFT_220116 [Capitella teleta]